MEPVLFYSAKQPGAHSRVWSTGSQPDQPSEAALPIARNRATARGIPLLEEHRVSTTLPQLLTSAEVADALRITDETLRAMRSRTPSEGPDYIKLPNGRIRYTVEAVKAWMDGAK